MPRAQSLAAAQQSIPIPNEANQQYEGAELETAAQDQ
jgi:hypothetical protein